MKNDDKQFKSSQFIVADELTPKYTRSGARRAGDEYQDIIALELIVRMLEHPKEFKWIKVEANEAGYLDDVFALLSNDSIIARQVKFATDPDTVWSWNDLLEPASSSSSSLLEKWFLSWKRVQTFGHINEIGLWTNRKPAHDLQRCLSTDKRIRFLKIPIDIRKRISKQLGTQKNIKAFFKEFIFNFEAPSLDGFHDSVRRRFFQIGGEESGWTSLIAAMRLWVKFKNVPQPYGEIDLRAARSAANWYQLRELPQSFEIPRDYVLPSKSFHDLVLSRIKKSKKGCLVISSPPGLGKSTYLSFLSKDLRRRKIPIIRHHYYLSESDKSGNRFDHIRVIESLMSELQKRYSSSITQNDASNPTPNPNNFTEWIKNAGKYFNDNGQPFVIIIDGLDHVFREQKNDTELNNLFNYLLPVEQGIFLIVGTQPIIDEYLPSRLVTKVPRSEWLELPNLNRYAVKRWVNFHHEELKIHRKREDDYWLSEAASGFYQLSKGHPLVLKYSLSELVQQGLWANKTNILLLTHSTTREIDNYYKTLWRGLDSASRTILCLLSACPFAWSTEGVLECLSSSVSEKTTFIEAFRRVKHLFIEEAIGLQAFHQSLQLFVIATEEYRLHQKDLKQRALTWLGNNAPQYLRWSYEWRLEAELGNKRSIINGPSRQWAIESLSKRYPGLDAIAILYEAGKYALEDGNLSKYVEHGLLRDYYGTSLDYQGDAINAMLEAQLYLREDPMLTLRLSTEVDTLDDDELLILARFAFLEGNRRLVSRIFECINDNLKSIPRHDVTDKSGTIVTQIASLSDDVGVDRVIDYIIRQRRNRQNIVELTTYCEECLRNSNISKLRELYKNRKRFEPDEYAIVMHYLVLHALENNVDIKSYFKKVFINDPIVELFKIIKNNKASRPNLQFPDTRLLDLREYEVYKYTETISSFFSRCYFIFVVNHCLGESKINQSWLDEIGTSSWPRRFLHEINMIAEKWSVSLKDHNPVPYMWFFEAVEHFQKPDWRIDDSFRYGQAADEFVVSTSFQVLRFNFIMERRPHISKADVEIVFKSRYAHRRQWLKSYLQMNRNWLSADAYNWIIETSQNELRNTVEQFGERASVLTDIAILAARNGMDEKCKELTICISENLLTYGGHKDMLFSSVLDSIMTCHRAGIDRAKRWLLDLTPAISEIRNYTDGDETSHIPRELGDILVEINTEWFTSYHGWLLLREEYYDALDGFHSFLEKADLASELNRHLATTAIDEDSLRILKRRVESGDAHAEIVIKEIEGMFGKIRLEDEESQQHGTSEYQHQTKSKLPDPALYPPAQLDNYIKALNSDKPYDIEHPLMNWLQQWAQGVEIADCMDLVEKKMENATFHDLADIILDLSVKHSITENLYSRLVKASINNSCWSRYFTSYDKAKKYWLVLKNIYPSKWYEFVKDTMYNPYERSFMVTGSSVLFRLVEYLILFDQQELAATITENAVKFSQELVSPLNLRPLTWTKPYED